MRVWALWHGGSSYAVGSIPEDLETFDSIREAKSIMEARESNWGGDTPCVESDSMWLFFADPTDERDPYPDRVLERGPRGGICCTRA